jgi:hypothetical protein
VPPTVFADVDNSSVIAQEEVAGHFQAGADEVIFSFAFADTAGITAVRQALRLGGR